MPVGVDRRCAGGPCPHCRRCRSRSREAAAMASAARRSGPAPEPASDGARRQLDPTALEHRPARSPAPTASPPAAASSGSPTGTSNTVTRVNAQSRQVEGDPIQVGAEPDSLAEGLGAMWVTNTSGNSVTRMDLGTGEPLGTHPVARRARGDPGRARVGLGREWSRRLGQPPRRRAATSSAKADVGRGARSARRHGRRGLGHGEQGEQDRRARPRQRRPDRPQPSRSTARRAASPTSRYRGELWVSASAADRS